MNKMIYYLGLLATLTAVTADTCAQYSGGYCKNYASYPVFLPTGSSVSTIEGLLKSGGMDLLLTVNSSNIAARSCISAYLEWSCYSYYPSCSEDHVKDVPCKSVCLNASAQCQTLFAMFGKISSLPDCTENLPGLHVPYGETSTCLGYIPSSGNTTAVISSPQPTGPITCPSFLLPNPNYNPSSPHSEQILGQMCNGPCCVPCPHILQLYDRGSVQTLSIIYQVLAVISFLCSIFLVLSYIVFPQKRIFPGSIIWYYMMGVFILHLNQMSVVGSDGFRVSCVDSITEAHQQNSTGCAVQTFVQTFAAMYLIYWINVFMLNVHLSIVWKKDWFSERMVLLNLIGLVYGLVPSIGVLVSGSSTTTGFNCMVDPQHVIGWILIPLGVIAWPGVGVTIFTVIYLIRLFLSAPGALPAKPYSSGKNQSEPNGSTTQEASNTQSAATKGVPIRPTAQVGEIQRMESSIPQDQTKPKNAVVNSSSAEESVTKAAKNSKAHKERVLGVLKKTWRSIALSVAIVIVFGSFWSFNLQIALTFVNVSPTTPWLASWYACALQGNSRTVCAQQVAPNIPSFIGVALSNITCGIGLMVFLIFGTAMLEDWKKLIVDKFFN